MLHSWDRLLIVASSPHADALIRNQSHFRCWHLGDMATDPDDVRFQGKTGVRRETGKE